MDFASIMQSQIAKSARPKKSSAGSSKPDTSSTASAKPSASSKYVRRADVEAQRLAAYQAEQAALEASRQEKLLKRQREEEEERERAAVRAAKKAKLAEESKLAREEEARQEEIARRKRLGLPPLPEPGKEDADGGDVSSTDDSEDDDDDLLDTGVISTAREDEALIDEDKVKKRLREMEEPVTLFGEQPAARLKRWRGLARAARKKARRNEREKMEAGKPRLGATGPIITTINLLPEEEIGEIPAKPPAAPSSSSSSEKGTNGLEAEAAGWKRRAHLYRQLASYFALVFREWNIALSSRPDAVKASSTGRQALAGYEAARQSMLPLFRFFEQGIKQERQRVRRARKAAAAALTTGTTITTTTTTKNNDKNNKEDPPPIPTAVLEGLVSIAHSAQARRYVTASDAYLTLSIGKAAWPIGVTMVGIHERSAREKLHQGDGARTAHIMSDETTRRYLQAVKACLAFAQTRWVPGDHLQLMG